MARPFRTRNVFTGRDLDPQVHGSEVLTRWLLDNDLVDEMMLTMLALSALSTSLFGRSDTDYKRWGVLHGKCRDR